MRFLLWHEWRLLWADRSFAFVAVVSLLMFGLGAANGCRWLATHLQSVSGLAEKGHGKLAELEQGARAAEAAGKRDDPAFNPFRASVVAQTAVLPPAPLAALAIGQADILPDSVNITVWTGNHPFAGTYDYRSPQALMAGPFDLSFVLVYLYPLLILAISYNLVSAEREQGTLALALSQPVSLGRLVAAKMIVRLAVLIGIVLFGSLGTMAAFDRLRLDAPGRLLIWIALVVSYGGFWFFLSVAVNALGKGSAANAVILIALWLALVLVVPALANVLVSTLYPMPSRVEMLVASRSVSIDARRDGSKLLARYYEDHPELVPAVSQKDLEDIKNFNIRALLTVRETQSLTDPIADRFEEQSRKRQAFVTGCRFLSPAIVMREALNDLSGTGLGRFQSFRNQAERFSRDWRTFFSDYIFQRKPFTSADYRRIPRFVFVEESPKELFGRVGAGLLGLLVPSVVLAAVGFRRNHRFLVVS